MLGRASLAVAARFVAASTGKVELDIRECNVHREPAEATVTWTVK